MLAVIRVLMEFSNNRLLALDVTGDFSPVDVAGLYRHVLLHPAVLPLRRLIILPCIDRHHLHKTQHSDEQNFIDPSKALPSNQASNLAILQTITECLHGQNRDHEIEGALIFFSPLHSPIFSLHLSLVILYFLLFFPRFLPFPFFLFLSNNLTS